MTVRVRFGHLATGWFDLLLLSIDELLAIVEPLGWALTDHWSDGSAQTVTLSME